MSEAPQVNVKQETNSIIERVKAVANTAIESIKTTKEEFDAAKTETQAARRSLNTVKRNFDDRVNEVEQLNKTYQEIEGGLSAIKISVKESNAQVQADVKAINDNKNILVGLKDESDKELTQIKSLNAEIFKNVEESNKRHDEIIDLSNSLLKDGKDEEGNVTNPCVSTRINNTYSSAEENLNKIKNDRKTTGEEFDNLKIELKQKILDLLPEASATTLAHGFYTAKKKHDKFFSTSVFYILFVAPLVFVSWYFISEYAGKDAINIAEFFARILIVSPLLGVSTFGVYSIYRNRKLYEHYNHKQRVTQMYEGFDRAIKEDGYDDAREALTDILLATVSEKISESDKYEKDPSLLNAVMKRAKILEPVKSREGKEE